jgi:hypothetical protein
VTEHETEVWKIVYEVYVVGLEPRLNTEYFDTATQAAERVLELLRLRPDGVTVKRKLVRP